MELIEVLLIGMEFLKLVHGFGDVFALSDKVLVLCFDEVLGLSLVVSALFDYLGLFCDELFPLVDLK